MSSQSPFIHVMQVRFEYYPRGLAEEYHRSKGLLYGKPDNAPGYFLKLSIHESSCIYSRLVLCKVVHEHDPLHLKLESQQWDCIVLEDTERTGKDRYGWMEPGIFLIVIDWHGNSAERIGHAGLGLHSKSDYICKIDGFFHGASSSIRGEFKEFILSVVEGAQRTRRTITLG
jgi:hypothetical protein